MASPQKENGYTPIANELLEVFMCAKLNEYERVVFLFVARQTYGWRKKKDRLSNGIISRRTGIPRPNVVRTLRSLSAKKMVEKAGGIVTIQKDWEQWVLEWRVVPREILGEYRVVSPQILPSVSTDTSASVSTDTKTSVSTDTHKRKKEIYKETNTKETIRTKSKEVAIKGVSYGELGMVKLTDAEYAKLCEKLGKPIADSLIEELDLYISSKGARYKSHYATVLGWARRRVNEHHARSISRGKGII